MRGIAYYACPQKCRAERKSRRSAQRRRRVVFHITVNCRRHPAECEAKYFFFERAKMTLFARSLNLPMLWLTERVNLRHYIFCVPLKVPQRGKNRSGFPSNSRHFVLSAQNKMCERFYILSRKENRAFPRRTPVWQSFALRGKSECAALHTMRALKNAAQRENPAARHNADGGLSFTSR